MVAWCWNQWHLRHGWHWHSHICHLVFLIATLIIRCVICTQFVGVDLVLGGWVLSIMNERVGTHTLRNLKSFVFIHFNNICRFSYCYFFGFLSKEIPSSEIRSRYQIITIIHVLFVFYLLFFCAREELSKSLSDSSRLMIHLQRQISLLMITRPIYILLLIIFFIIIIHEFDLELKTIIIFKVNYIKVESLAVALINVSTF